MSLDIDGVKARLARYRAATGPGATSAVDALVVRPGDTLIVGLNKSVTVEVSRRVAARLSEALPEVRVAVVDSVAGLAVYRPDGVESAAIDPAAGDHPGAGLLDRDALVPDGEGRVESSQARGAETPR